MRTPNYHQARKLKEQKRKQRQSEKQERRSTRPERNADGSPGPATGEDPVQAVLPGREAP
jgi:hypothetical protein